MCIDRLSGKVNSPAESQRIKSQTLYTEREIFQDKEMASRRPLSRTGGMGSHESPLAIIKRTSRGME